jgi:hypothetical protein
VVVGDTERGCLAEMLLVAMPKLDWLDYGRGQESTEFGVQGDSMSIVYLVLVFCLYICGIVQGHSRFFPFL